MKKSELIAALAAFPDDFEVMILDGCNSGGHPREINLGPLEARIRQEDEEWVCECEGRVGEVVVVIGYGSY